MIRRWEKGQDSSSPIDKSEMMRSAYATRALELLRIILEDADTTSFTIAEIEEFVRRGNKKSGFVAAHINWLVENGYVGDNNDGTLHTTGKEPPPKKYSRGDVR